MSHTVAIPTWRNPAQLRDTLLSLVRNTDFSGRIIVVENGGEHYDLVQGAVPYEIDWYEQDENLGWIGGVNFALEKSDTDFFTMLNDDVLFPPASTEFWDRTLRWFDSPDTGGVGPSSNYVAGYQNAFLPLGHPVLSVPFLIGFCATYRTEHLKELGGLDPSLPGGDDLDLSIRVRDKGLQLLADRRNFLFHHGAQTGQRVHPGFWDSQMHQADTYNALIRKHGLRKWYECMNGVAGDWVSFAVARNTTRVTRRAMQSRDKTIDGLFAKARTTPSDVNEHLDILFRYASGCEVVCEFGVADCTTTAAFLKARPNELHSYDVVRQPAVSEVEKIADAEGQHFEFHLGSTLDVEIPECDLLYVDDLHVYGHVKAELAKHAGRVRRYMAFHDTEMFLERSEDNTKPGIWNAIAEFLREHPEWALTYSTEEYAGLVVLTRLR